MTDDRPDEGWPFDRAFHGVLSRSGAAVTEYRSFPTVKATVAIAEHPPWFAQVTFRVDDGGTRPMEVRVFTGEPTPTEPLSTTILRCVRISQIQRQTWASLREMASQVETSIETETIFNDLGVELDPVAVREALYKLRETIDAPRRMFQPRSSAKRSRGPAWYARLAADYIELQSHAAPVQELARRYKLEPSQARDALSKARELGFLRSKGRGRPGGTLTDDARRILDGTR